MTEKGEKNKRGRKTDKRDSLRERISEDLRNGVFSGTVSGLNVTLTSPACAVKASPREISKRPKRLHVLMRPLVFLVEGHSFPLPITFENFG